MTLKPSDVQKARRHLRAADPVMKAVIDAVGPFTLRLERDRFGTVVRSMASWYCWRTLDLARKANNVAKGYPT